MELYNCIVKHNSQFIRSVSVIYSYMFRLVYKLSVFENIVLRRIFGPRRDEVTGGMEETA